jgi:Asp-tRNA(Asn)/Glu-tRNA(Gln) amidotransferase A subunit family amidase
MLAELAAAVRDGRTSPRHLVDVALARIETLDPGLGAVVSVCADDARRAADDHPRRGPLAGIPMLVKDLYAVEGLPTSFGSRLFAGSLPEPADDEITARYRAAGAIVIGKSNTPAFGHTAVTINDLFGATRNPWNRDRTPGGSSGGSAAALAAALVPLASSSDGGGSVRIPAAMCGLVGYKPTFGRQGRVGSPKWMTFSSAGAMGRNVADVLLEHSVIAGTVPGDLYSAPVDAFTSRSDRPGTTRLPRRVLATPSLRDGVDGPVAANFASACQLLGEALGIEIEMVENPTVLDDVAAWWQIAVADLAHGLRDHWDEIDRFEPLLQLMIELGRHLPLADYLDAQRHRFDACRRWDDLLGDDAVLLTPTCNAEAWDALSPMIDTAGGVTHPSVAVNTPELNLTGHPAVSVPMGLDSNAVPTGLQIIGPRWGDTACLGVAAAFERTAPWPQVAPGYEPFPMF